MVWYLGGHEGVDYFCHNTPLEMHLSLFHFENGQNEYILIIFSFTNIV